MRTLLFLLLLAAPLLAQGDEERLVERMRKLIAEGRPEVALAEFASAGPERPGPVLRLARAEAQRAVARQVQRDEGHAAAAEFLEGCLDHKLTVVAYAEACAWAGEEERAIRRLRTLDFPLEQRLPSELWLLSLLGRFEEAAVRATEVDWEEGATYYREMAVTRSRLDGFARRGVWAAVIAAVALLAGSLLLLTLAPRAGTARARSAA